MYIDIVFVSEKKEALELGRRLGFSDLIFIKKSDIKRDVRNLGKKSVVLGGNSELNRAALMSRNTVMLLDPEPMDENNTGMNHVLCRLAHDNNIAIGISFSRILNEKNRVLLLGKIMQNIKIYRKYRVNVVLASFANNLHEMRDAVDMMSFARVIGMSTGDAKNSLIIAREVLKGL